MAGVSDAALEEPRDHEEDLRLVRAASTGDVRACRELADRLLDRVRATAYCIAAGDRELDDLVQSSLLEILRNVHTFTGEGSLHAWADRITARTCLRLLRRRRRRQGRAQEVIEHEEATRAPGEPSDERAVQQQLRGCLLDLLGRLSIKQRSAIVLRLVHGYTVEEIARMSDSSINTVRYRLKAGRRTLLRTVKRDARFLDWLGR